MLAPWTLLSGYPFIILLPLSAPTDMDITTCNFLNIKFIGYDILILYSLCLTYLTCRVLDLILFWPFVVFKLICDWLQTITSQIFTRQNYVITTIPSCDLWNNNSLVKENYEMAQLVFAHSCHNVYFVEMHEMEVDRLYVYCKWFSILPTIFCIM